MNGHHTVGRRAVAAGLAAATLALAAPYAAGPASAAARPSSSAVSAVTRAEAADVGPAVPAAASSRVPSKRVIDGAPTITIDSITPVVTSKNQTVEVVGAITGGSTAATGDLCLKVAAAPLESAQDIQNWPDEVSSTQKAWAVPGCEVIHDPLQDGVAQNFHFDVKATDLGFGQQPKSPWGPRGIAVDFSTLAGSIASAATYIVYAPPEAVTSPTTVTVVAPLIQDADQTPDQAAQDATQTLTAAADLPVDWAFDPALVDQDAAGQDAAGLAAGLADVAAKRGVFALPYGDTDVSQLAHAGVHDTDVLDLAEQRTKAVVKTAFDSTTQGFVHTDLMWPASAADSQLVSMLNRDAHTKYALAPVTTTTPAGTWGRPAVATLRVGSYHVTGIIPETQKGVGDAFAAYLASGTLKDRQVLLADLALRGLATQARSTDSTIVLTVPRGLGIGGQDLATRLGTVFGLPWLTAKSLIDVEDSTSESQIYVTSGKDPGRGPSTEVLDKLTGLAARAIPFAQITGNAQAFEAQAAEQLAGPLAVSLPADQRAQKATAAVQQMTATLGQVKIVKGSEVNLIAEAGQVPVVVRNTSAQAVTVQVAFDVADPVIRARKSARIHVAAGEQATAMVPIRAIANGTVQVKATLVNAHGAAVSGATSFAVRVHAEWENIGTLIFAVLVVLLFGFGLVRSIRRRRRERDARADGAAA